MSRTAASAVVCALVLSGTLAAAQVFRGGTDVVLLSVTVTDNAGRHVTGLTKNDFHVFEDSVLQEISHFSDQPEPVSLSLLLDTSNSMEMQNKLALAQAAAAGFITRLGPKDVAQIVDFDSQTKILATFTDDKDVLLKALRLTKAGGSTSLYNSIYTALSDLKRLRRSSAGEMRRQAIILLSDGEDTSSLVQYEDVIDQAKRSEVIVYAVALTTKDQPVTRGWNEAEFVLRSLTRDTGGRLFTVVDPEQLPAIYVQISEELANQYAVGYMSKNAKKDGTWRRVTVQVLKGDAMPRTRSGYFAPTEKK